MISNKMRHSSLTILHIVQYLGSWPVFRAAFQMRKVFGGKRVLFSCDMIWKKFFTNTYMYYYRIYNVILLLCLNSRVDRDKFDGLQINIMMVFYKSIVITGNNCVKACQ
jgi:hypothetical protein